MQNMMGAMGGNINAHVLNLQQAGQLPQAGHQLVVGGQADHQLQGFMAMNNPNINMANMNANLGLNNVNQPHDQNNQQLQFIKLLAQQQQQQQPGIGLNQRQIEAAKGQMQPLMPNQSLMPNQTQLFQQQQLQMNLLKRQKEINAQSNSSSPTRGLNVNANSTSSPVQHMQLPAEQAQAQNMLLNVQQEGDHSNQRRPSLRSSFVVQNHGPHSDSNAQAGLHRPGSGASNLQQPNQKRPSSRISVGGMSNITQSWNENQSHSGVSSHGQIQQHHSRPGPNNISMGRVQNSQQRMQTQTPINQQSISSGQLMMPNQLLPQQSQYAMQNLWNQQFDQSNFPSTSLQTSQVGMQPREPSQHSQRETQPRRPSNYAGAPSNDDQTQMSIQRQHTDEMQVQIPPEGNINRDSKSSGGIYPTDQSATPQSKQKSLSQQDPSAPTGATGQHHDQQAQAQAWFLFQQVRFLSN